MKDLYSENYKIPRTEMEDTCEGINTISMFILLKRFIEPCMNYRYIIPFKILMTFKAEMQILQSVQYI